MKNSTKAKLFGLAAAVAICLGALTFPGGAVAEEPNWMVAAGAAARPDYEGSDDTEAFPIGSFKMWWDSGRYIELVGARSSGSAARFAANIIDKNRIDYWELGPVIQYRMPRDDVDNNAVDALPDIDGAVELGGFVAADLDPFRVQLTGASDVSDEHEGSTIELAADYTLRPTSTLQITPGIASTWASDDYMRSYFGVTPAGSSASGLPVYSADEGVKDFGFRLRAMWAGPGNGWEHWRVMGLFSYFSMLKDAKDSPVVDIAGNDDQIFGGIVVAWEN